MIYNDNSKEEILKSILALKKMHIQGKLGGEVMPEDSNPGLDQNSMDNYHYFTLPMSLNYQRNSYVLWQSSKTSFLDESVSVIFNPQKVINMSDDDLKSKLTKYKVALQAQKQTEIWKKICHSICTLFDGDIRNLFIETNGDIPSILELVQGKYKKCFPYLSGPKICNYWLYVMDNYTDVKLTGKEFLSVAPDTHVIQATIKLGIVDSDEQNSPQIQSKVNNAWKEVLEGTGMLPIDIHTPLWLWSKSGFKTIVY